MDKVTIPASIEEATERLEGLGALLTATGWERAAIVYAFTRLDEKGGDRKSEAAIKVRSDFDRLTPDEFAALGIHGLKSKNTVRLHHERWAEHGRAKTVKPGQTVTLPTVEWPPIDPRVGENGRLQLSPTTPIGDVLDRLKKERGSEAVADAIADDPELAEPLISNVALKNPEAITEAMNADPDVYLGVAAAQNRTEASKQATRNANRAVREHQARQAEMPVVIESAAVLQVMWEVEALVNKVEEAERTESNLFMSGHFRDWLRSAAARVDAWVEGITRPLSDEDFEAEIKALIDSE